MTTDVASKVLRDQVASGNTPAVQYRFVGPDAVIIRNDEGVADVVSGKPVSSTTTYNWFSVTKTFTALAVLRLAERGLIEIDGVAADYLPNFPYPRQITIRHLLAHSAGLPNPVPLSWIHLKEEHSSFDRDSFFRAIFVRHSKVKSQPNARFAYSNLGYILLGQIIESVTGTRYELYVTQAILEPLGLSASDLGFVLNDDHQARGYHRKRSISYLLLSLFLNRSRFMEPAARGWQPFGRFT